VGINLETNNWSYKSKSPKGHRSGKGICYIKQAELMVSNKVQGAEWCKKVVDKLLAELTIMR